MAQGKDEGIGIMSRENVRMLLLAIILLCLVGNIAGVVMTHSETMNRETGTGMYFFTLIILICIATGGVKE